MKKELWEEPRWILQHIMFAPVPTPEVEYEEWFKYQDGFLSRLEYCQPVIAWNNIKTRPGVLFALHA